MVRKPGPRNPDFPRRRLTLIVVVDDTHHPSHRTLPFPFPLTLSLTRSRADTRIDVTAKMLRRHERQPTPSTRPNPRRPPTRVCARSHLNRLKHITIE